METTTYNGDQKCFQQGLHTLYQRWQPTSERADLVGDGISKDALLFDVHNKYALHSQLLCLQSSAVPVSAIPVCDVLSDLESEGLCSFFS